MLELTTKDKELLDTSYEMFLHNLYDYLQDSGATSGLDLAIEVIRMLHSGKFGMNGNNTCTNDYDFLYLPNLESDGMLVMYGVCCCRHATKLLYDILTILNFECSLVYIAVLEDGSWRTSQPSDANHIVVQYEESGKRYLLDIVNKFVLEVLENGNLKQLEIEMEYSDCDYNDSNVFNIGKVLTKYYSLKKLGVNHIYDYRYGE